MVNRNRYGWPLYPATPPNFTHPILPIQSDQRSRTGMIQSLLKPRQATQMLRSDGLTKQGRVIRWLRPWRWLSTLAKLPVLVVLPVLAVLTLFSGVALSNPELASPTQDAKENRANGQVDFVAIELAEGREIPGLKPHQLAVVEKEYTIRSLNRRWKTFANIEQQPDEYRRLKRYAIRYNLMMWKLERSASSDRFKYRY
jgi:hypothetical protein